MKIKLLLFSLVFMASAQAQVKFFLEGGANLVSINQDAGINANVSANILVKSIYFGAFYERLVTRNTDIIPSFNSVPTPSDPFDTSRYFSQSTGVKVGFIILPNRLLSISPEVGFGWSDVFWEEARSQRDQYWNIVPALKLSLKASKALRIGVSANYRYYTELSFDNNLPSISSQRLGGIGGGLFLRVGNF